MREIVLDTETTGLDPATGDRLVEIGCVALENSLPNGDTFHVYLNPERDMPNEAFQIHGLSYEFLSDKPKFDEVADSFLNFISDSNLIIHNAEFDIKFLNHELAQAGKPTIEKYRVVDTLALARKKHPGSPNSLDALCGRYRIDNSRRTKHGALLDSELLAEVYLELIGGRQTVFTLKQEQPRAIELARVAILTARPGELPRRLGTETIAKHKKLQDSIGGRLVWSKYFDE